jgi:peptidyl-prolyl cis-trans isomerase-like 4
LTIDLFPDSPGLVQPPSSPCDPRRLLQVREDKDLLFTFQKERLNAMAVVISVLMLEMVDNLPFANVSPPENVLSCASSIITRDDDLELIFSRLIQS